MDIALAVEQLLPAADFRRCKTYQDLVDTWVDNRPIPTEAELEAAWSTLESLAAEESQREAMIVQIKMLAASLAEIFQNMSPALRGRLYPVRAGVKLALEEGDVEAALATVEGIEAVTTKEEEIKQSLMDLFPAEQP